MSRGLNEQPRAHRARCGAVWLLASTATAATWWLVAPTCIELGTADGWSDTFDALLVKLCGAALLLSTTWLWTVMTCTVVGAVNGSAGGGGAIGRLVLLACGVALATGAAAPATAQGGASTPPEGQTAGSGQSLIAGLSLPDRAMVQPRPHPSEKGAGGTGHVVVVRGDSLWSIAESHEPGSSVDERWRTIWTANHELIGEDPDLILPGQHLTLPPPPNSTPTHTTPAADTDNRRAR